MLSDFVDCFVADRRHRLLEQAQAAGAARPTPSRPLHVRIAALRSDLGFRLVEAGLRLAVGRGAAEVGRRSPR